MGGRPEWPAGPRFVVARTGWTDNLVAHLKELMPYLMVLEATGGFETVVVAGPAQVRPSPGPPVSVPVDAAVIAHLGAAESTLRAGLTFEHVSLQSTFLRAPMR